MPKVSPAQDAEIPLEPTKAPWYHGGMSKNFTVRLPDELAADAEALARVEGQSLNETIKQALTESIERRRKDPKFKARIRKIIEEDREILDRLAR
ncbi:MAG: toxin-antitoxin system HicB family antitoxin [Acidimicrobiia bacterium]